MVSMDSLHGINMDPFKQSWLVIVRIESYPSEGGSLVMKSRAITSKGWASGLVVMGNCGGFGHVVMFLWDWQVTQPHMYSVMKFFILGHQ